MKMTILNYNLILTCEHAGQRIYPELKGFKLPRYYKNSHQAYDLGALKLAQLLQSKTKAPLFYFNYSRLIIDANRSDSNPAVWGPFGKNLNLKLKQTIKQNYYDPFRGNVYSRIKKSPKPVLHLSIHSMAANLNNVDRDCDISFLYDSKRQKERALCLDLKSVCELFGLKCRLNYPYLGKSDGHCTSLRKFFSQQDYLGIEVEVNQKNIDHINVISDIIHFGLKLQS
ncbi:MAG: N-formylglutamate amidohydrolase [Bdellovibrionales bacterium]|nr:N-formylglutamate amidohydrolase [Bdellovibrionales bacterium]